MKISALFIPVVLLFVAAALAGDAATAEKPQPCCKPAFREVSEDLIIADVGTWRLDLKVALIGCEDQLRSLSDEELRRIEEEFRDPTLWSNITLIKRYMDPDLRRTAALRVNELIGKQVVQDVLLHDLALYDDIR